MINRLILAVTNTWKGSSSQSSLLTDRIELGVDTKANKGRQKHQYIRDYGCLALVHVGTKSDHTRAEAGMEIQPSLSAFCQV